MIQEKTLYYPPVLSCIPACQRSSQRCQRALCVTVTRRKQKNGPVCTDSYTHVYQVFYQGIYTFVREAKIDVCTMGRLPVGKNDQWGRLRENRNFWPDRSTRTPSWIMGVTGGRTKARPPNKRDAYLMYQYHSSRQTTG